MIRCFALVIAIWCAALGMARAAETPEDHFLQAFNLIQEADALSSSEPRDAVSKYQEAKGILQQLQHDNPNWSTLVVSFRLEYVSEKIIALNPKLAGAPGGSTNGVEASHSQPARPPAPEDWDLQLNAVKEQVRQLQAERGLLEAKLKEAFAARPAQTDPLEFARVGEKLKVLQKENELLKVALDSAKHQPAPAAETKTPEKAQQALLDSNRELMEAKASAAKLALERDALQSRLRAVSTNDGSAAALVVENQLLKQQLHELRAGPSVKSKAEEATRQLSLVQAQLASAQSDKELLSVQNIALQARVKQLTAGAPAGTLPGSQPSPEAARMDMLEQERDDLRKQLATAKQATASKGAVSGVRSEELERQVAGLRAQLDVLEARAIPYKAEELAILKLPTPNTQPLEVSSGRKSIRELSPAAARLVSAARGYYEAGQYDKAESTYLQVLADDEKNVPVLTDLASIQVEGAHLSQAETNILRALALAPKSAYGLSVLGRLRFRQGKYDDALEALSSAAKLEPDNAEIQNFLGLTLSHKGLRGPAETALRKAIELQPDYASAHNNLAVVYLTGKPPAVELARWHYQKALSAGGPHNLELEKLLNSSK